MLTSVGRAGRGGWRAQYRLCAAAGATGDVALEKVISMKPDAYIVSGSQWASKTNAAVPFGYGVTQQQVDEAFNRMKQRPGFAQVSAVKEGRFYGIYHNFYNHPYNIVGLEYLAKFIYPAQFPDLDPAKTYSEILSRFTEVPEGKGILGAQAPAGITATGATIAPVFIVRRPAYRWR